MQSKLELPYGFSHLYPGLCGGTGVNIQQRSRGPHYTTLADSLDKAGFLIILGHLDEILRDGHQMLAAVGITVGAGDNFFALLEQRKPILQRDFVTPIGTAIANFHDIKINVSQAVIRIDFD